MIPLILFDHTVHLRFWYAFYYNDSLSVLVNVDELLKDDHRTSSYQVLIIPNGFPLIRSAIAQLDENCTLNHNDFKMECYRKFRELCLI